MEEMMVQAGWSRAFRHYQGGFYELVFYKSPLNIYDYLINSNIIRVIIHAEPMNLVLCKDSNRDHVIHLLPPSLVHTHPHTVILAVLSALQQGGN